MPYPDNFSTAAYDAAQGVDDDDDAIPPPDQLILTITPNGAFIEATGRAAGALRVDASDVDDVLDLIADWLIEARIRQGGAP